MLSILLLAIMAIFILRSLNTLYFTTLVFSIQNRFNYWQRALTLILKHPFRGIGLGNLPFIGSKFVHNSYLQIWVEVGLLGIASFLGFLYNFFKSIQIKRLAEDTLYAGCTIASFGFLIHNLIDFSFFLPEVSVTWWIIIALFLSHQQLPR
jgi:O-antigen ligase